MYFGESLNFFPVYQEFCHLYVKMMVFEGRGQFVSVHESASIVVPLGERVGMDGE